MDHEGTVSEYHFQVSAIYSISAKNEYPGSGVSFRYLCSQVASKLGVATDSSPKYT